MKTKWLIIGLVIVAVISLLYVSPFGTLFRSYTTNDFIEEDRQIVSEIQEPTLDINKIQVEMDGENNIDLWVNGNGGKREQTNYISITNNNEMMVCFYVYCESDINIYNGLCSPTSIDNVETCVGPNLRQTAEIHISTGISPDTIEGTYGGKIVIETSKPNWNSIKTFPIDIIVHNNRD